MIVRRTHTCKKLQGFTVPYDNKRIVIQHAWGKMAKNLDFIKNSLCTRGSTEGVVHRCSVGKLY